MTVLAEKKARLRPGRGPVPVAFIGRTSTLESPGPPRVAEPAAPRRPGMAAARVVPRRRLLGHRVRRHRPRTPQPGRGLGGALRRPDLPRDGGMADLLRAKPSPAPRFAAVVCEDIERSGRDMFNALKLEKELSRQGMPLFAADEPADIEGVNATTVLVRRVKQGVAKWYGSEGKDLEKARGALPRRVEHRHPALRVSRRPHPAPRAVQGRPGPHQIPAHPRPRPRPRHRADVHLADRGQARLPGHRRPPQRRPRQLPPAQPGHRVDRAERPGHARQPQVHRAHGLRPPPHPQRPPHPRPG